jgi:uncharacterized membrane protein
MGSTAPHAEGTGRRVVILSPGGAFTVNLLAGLAARGITADALLLYRPSLAREWRTARARGWLPACTVPARWLARRIRDRAGGRYGGGAGAAVFTGALNGARMTRDLRRLRPDVVVLARCMLLAPHVLAVPREGTVNVHPGLLPWVRGNSPIGNSLLRGVPLGSTSFWVDAGTDTGRIIERRLVPVAGGEALPALRQALHRLWVEMTVDAVAAARAGTLPPGTAQAGRFPLCRELSAPGEVRAIEDAVRRDTARILLDAWRPRCDDRLRLSADAAPAAPAGDVAGSAHPSASGGRP